MGNLPDFKLKSCKIFMRASNGKFQQEQGPVTAHAATVQRAS